MRILFFLGVLLSAFVRAEDERPAHDHSSLPRPTHSHDLPSQTKKAIPHDPSVPPSPSRSHSHADYSKSETPTSCAAHARSSSSMDQISSEAKPDFKPIDAHGSLLGPAAAAGEVFHFDANENRISINRPTEKPHDDYYALLGKSAWERMNRRLSFRCGSEGIKYGQVRERSEKAFDLALGKALFAQLPAVKPEGASEFSRALASVPTRNFSPVTVQRK